MMVTIRNSWEEYCMDIYYDTCGKGKPRVMGFLWQQAKGLIAPYICRIVGHHVVDCSTAGPNSGDADHCCSRCGKYWHIQLY